ncbi:MAG: hypothetical protein ACTSU4_00325 [Promethearchaeota archaeon]
MVQITSVDIEEEEEEGRIKQGTIAQFMRKRTQLVGFEFGYWKHVQYCAEFLDNALDAIEEFQWQELKKPDSKIKFSLDQELSLENISLIEDEMEKRDAQRLEYNAKEILKKELENGVELTKQKDSKILKEEKEEGAVELKDKKKIEIEEEVMNIIEDMTELLKPVEKIIDTEPLVIIRLREAEASTYLTAELNQKNVMSYTFEIFDNGIGMNRGDIKKFGQYLASSKSTQLKQTRGSQGFGAPSAFSDAQNTTGKPIICVSKSAENVYATVTEFFTTSKNKKRYVIHPTDIDSPFLHGTYIKLNYLNTKYIRGYVDTYIRETAMLNSHITIIYIDPYGKEEKYPRLALSFPEEPKYAKPHPASTNIGDLQDLLSKSESYKTLTSFLKDNFVRISQKVADKIIDLAEKDLQDKLNILILKDGFLTKGSKSTDSIYFARKEKRIYGKSTKPRDKLVIYQLTSEELLNKYWKLIGEYDQQLKKNKKIVKEIKKLNDKIEKSEIKKEIKVYKKEIDQLKKKIKTLRKNKEDIKNKLHELLISSKEGLIELKKFKKREDFEDLINEVQISKTKPSNLTKNQFDSLFLAFKSINYMAPPTDTVIPVEETTLENTMIKELGLKISENLDDFDTPVDTLKEFREQLLEEKRKLLAGNNVKNNPNPFSQITVEENELIQLNSQILASIYINTTKTSKERVIQTIEDIVSLEETESKESYEEIFEYFLETFSKDDDFVAAETRRPTSGKGLAYVVEAVLAYSNRLEIPKRSRDVLSRFVNRTPKLRDSADCAITKAVQSVNWKNYKLDTYDNNLPKGPIKLLVNVSGPYVHLMFKSQSKNALADDENLIKEIKYCLEAIGRRLRVYLNRRIAITKREKRANLIEKYIPKFVNSLYNIAKEGSKFKDSLKKEELEMLIRTSITKKTPLQIAPKLIIKPKEEKKLEKPKDLEKKREISLKEKGEKPSKKKELEKKPLIKDIPKDLNKLTIKQLRSLAKKNDIKIPSKVKKSEIIKIIKKEIYKEEALVETPLVEEKEIEKVKTKTKEETKQILPETSLKKVKVKEKTKKKLPKPKQMELPIITTDRILEVLTDEWQTIKHLIFKLKIKDMLDARYLTVKLKELERKGIVEMDIKTGKTHWRLK